MGEPVIFVNGRDPLIPYSGAETYVRAAGRAAIRAGYEPHLFCVGESSHVTETPFGVVHCTRTPFRPIRTLMAAAHGPLIVRAIERFAATLGGPCLIHSFGDWSGVAANAARRLERSGHRCTLAATVWTTYAHETRGKLRGAGKAHGLATRIRLRCELGWTLIGIRPGVARALRRAEVVHVNYDSVRAIVAAEVGGHLRFRKTAYSPESAFLRESGERAPVPDFLTGLEPGGAPLIAAVSRHDARKGIDVLLHALALLRDGGVRFRACLAGGGELLERHRALAAGLGLRSCTLLPGRIPDALAVLDHADIFALPSIEEGSGSLALLEAMQAGNAPVASRIDGIPEDVIDGESALLVPPGDPAALAHALRRLVEDAGLRSRIACEARRAFRDRFSAARFAAEIGMMYSEIYASPRSGERE
ncbi:MAG: glycosyltransferase family 4 protein [Candidatus Odyssella sp.]|nr:glycosyltransferase family 4 protein [Candidatus Odyssella sp.]